MAQTGFLEPSLLAEQPEVGVRLARAEVIEVAQEFVIVSLGVQQLEVELAVLGYDPAPGDRVLVTGDAASGHFLIGVLSTARPRPKLTISSSENSRTTTIAVEDGDLELVAPRGAVRIVASAGFDATTAGAIDLRSRVAVRLSVFDRLGHALSRIGLTRRSAELQHEQVDIAAGRLHVKAAHSAIQGDALSAEVGTISLAARRVSTKLGTLLSTVDNAYHTVAGLWQLAADRTRMVVRGTSHHKAARLYSKADDVKVKANQIHLG